MGDLFNMPWQFVLVTYLTYIDSFYGDYLTCIDSFYGDLLNLEC